MSYLIFKDYKRTIQSDNLMQVIGSDLSLLITVERLAKKIIISKLTQKYLIEEELSETVVYSPSSIYKANQRIYLDAPIYNAASLYSINDLTLQAGKVYICTTAILSIEVFNPAHWLAIGAQYDMFFVTYPAKVFDAYAVYAIGDTVWYADKVYACLKPTIIYGHDAQLQANSNASVYNVFPNSNYSGVQSWGAGVAYSVSAGTLPTNATKWTFGDNRNDEIVSCCCAIILYELHSRIAPMSTPILRKERYYEKMDFLKDAATGTSVTLDVPVRQPLTGGRMRHGGNVKNQNFY